MPVLKSSSSQAQVNLEIRDVVILMLWHDMTWPMSMHRQKSITKYVMLMRHDDVIDVDYLDAPAQFKLEIWDDVFFNVGLKITRSLLDVEIVDPIFSRFHHTSSPRHVAMPPTPVGNID